LRPAGDLKASPGELAKLVQFFYAAARREDTQLVNTESILRMEAPETTLAAKKNGLRLGLRSLQLFEASKGGRGDDARPMTVELTASFLRIATCRNRTGVTLFC